jgi:hypothetical protein
MTWGQQSISGGLRGRRWVQYVCMYIHTYKRSDSRMQRPSAGSSLQHHINGSSLDGLVTRLHCPANHLIDHRAASDQSWRGARRQRSFNGISAACLSWPSKATAVGTHQGQGLTARLGLAMPVDELLQIHLPRMLRYSADVPLWLSQLSNPTTDSRHIIRDEERLSGRCRRTCHHGRMMTPSVLKAPDDC